MKRLTDRNKEIQLPCTGNGVFWARVHEKLARYEDTGLDPEEVRGIKTAYDEVQIPYEIVATGADAARVIRLLDADDEGRLLVLPCKVGDMVYFRRGRDIIGDTVERIVLDGMNQVFVGAHKVFIFRDFGKTVFLTREDAEKALEGTNND